MFLFWYRISWITCYNRNYFFVGGFVTCFSISLYRKPSFGFGIWYSILTFCRCGMNFFVYFSLLLRFLNSIIISYTQFKLVNYLNKYKTYDLKSNCPNFNPKGPKWWYRFFKAIKLFFKKLGQFLLKNKSYIIILSCLLRLVNIAIAGYGLFHYWDIDYTLFNDILNDFNAYYYDDMSDLNTNFNLSCLDLNYLYLLFNPYTLSCAFVEVFIFYVNPITMGSKSNIFLSSQNTTGNADSITSTTGTGPSTGASAGAGAGAGVGGGNTANTGGNTGGTNSTPWSQTRTSDGSGRGTGIPDWTTGFNLYPDWFIPGKNLTTLLPVELDRINTEYIAMDQTTKIRLRQQGLNILLQGRQRDRPATLLTLAQRAALGDAYIAHLGEDSASKTAKTELENGRYGLACIYTGSQAKTLTVLREIRDRYAS